MTARSPLVYVKKDDLHRTGISLSTFPFKKDKNEFDKDAYCVKHGNRVYKVTYAVYLTLGGKQR